VMLVFCFAAIAWYYPSCKKFTLMPCWDLALPG
jgi:hypothetical protein